MRRCPICKKEVPIDGRFRPFCCERCKEIDLGRWLNEEYRISRPMTEDERVQVTIETVSDEDDRPN